MNAAPRPSTTSSPSSPSRASAASPGRRRKLGVSQSALSHTIRGLEERLGLRLLTRTTRSVAPTEAGERLLVADRTAARRDRARAGALSELRDKPAGTIRITAGEHAADAVLWPALAEAPARLSRYQCRDHRRLRPDRHRRRALRRRRAAWRAGGEGHDRGAHRPRHAHGGGRRSPPISTAGRSRRRRRTSPTTIASICACRPMAAFYAWEFEKDGRELKVRVEGQLVFNNIALRLNAALAGLGLAYMPEDLVEATSCRRAAGARARGLVPAVSRLPSLLSEPPAYVAGLRSARRCAALSRIDAHRFEPPGQAYSEPLVIGSCRKRNHACQ